LGSSATGLGQRAPPGGLDGILRRTAYRSSMPEKEVKDIPRPLREQYEKAIAAIQRNNLDYAIAILGQVLHKEPAFYTGREALRAAQFKKAGSGRGFLRSSLAPPAARRYWRRGSSSCTPTRSRPSTPPNRFSIRIPTAWPRTGCWRRPPLPAIYPSRRPILEIVVPERPRPRSGVETRGGARPGRPQRRGEKILGELASTSPMIRTSCACSRTFRPTAPCPKAATMPRRGRGLLSRHLKDKAEAVSLEQEKREVKTDDVASRLLPNTRRVWQGPTQLAPAPYRRRAPHPEERVRPGPGVLQRIIDTQAWPSRRSSGPSRRRR